MKNVLIVGASGYVGAQLIPWLLEQGYYVVASARNIDYLDARTNPHPNLTLAYLDLSDANATDSLLNGNNIRFDLAFFLVHGMAQGHDFIDYEIDLAHNFSRALAKSSITHLIYLSAIQPENGHSQHLAARKATGDILRQSTKIIIELRAGVIIGAGSAAFEIMRDFVYNLPVLITPKWVDSKANPIALTNLNQYLLAIACNPPDQNEIFEIGGPDTLTYRDQFKLICQLTGKKYHLWATSLLTPSMAAYWLGIITSVPSNIGQALLGGLAHDYLADTRKIQSCYPQQLISYQDAALEAIESQRSFVRSNVWGFDPAALQRWQPGFGYYPKQAGATITTPASASALWQVAQKIGSRDKGYYFANGLWRLREWLDIFFSGHLPKRNIPKGPTLKLGDFIDSWKVIRCEENRCLSLFFGMSAPGLGRLEVTIKDRGAYRKLDIRAWWHPKGFLGLLYWFVMMPAHLFIFKGMAKAMAKEALAITNAPLPTDQQDNK